MNTELKQLIEDAAKPAQASPLDLMECLQDRPVEPSKSVQGKCVTKAEKQEPVKDEPVAWCVAYDDPRMGRIHSNPSMCKPELDVLVGRSTNQLVLVPLYTRLQPENTLWQTTAKSLGAEVDNIMAEVEFMQGKYEEMLAEWLPQKQRIAELEEAARSARDALQYKLHVVEAIAKLDGVLGNAAGKPTPD